MANRFQCDCCHELDSPSIEWHSTITIESREDEHLLYAQICRRCNDAIRGLINDYAKHARNGGLDEQSGQAKAGTPQADAGSKEEG